MKKVYIPTEEELHNLEKLGVNLYYYLVTKTIESMVMADVIYEEEDMFELAYDEFLDIPQIIYSIAKMYPERIIDSTKASNDIELCKKIIPTLVQNNTSVYGLDKIQNFNSIILENPEVMSSIIHTLVEQLSTSPKYRFEYNEPNNTLDKIFNGELNVQNMNFTTLKKLATIEPSYLTKVKNTIILPEVVESAIKQYAKTYGIDAFGIRTSPLTSMVNNDDKIKRLTRRLNIHRQYYDM